MLSSNYSSFSRTTKFIDEDIIEEGKKIEFIEKFDSAMLPLKLHFDKKFCFDKPSDDEKNYLKKMGAYNSTQLALLARIWNPSSINNISVTKESLTILCNNIPTILSVSDRLS